MNPVDEARAVERELRERLRGRRVVLEIGLSADLHERVTRVLEPIVKIGPADRLSLAFPALLATYLVGHAVYHYDSGGMWGSVDIDGIDQSWGERFTQAIAHLGLEKFDDLVEQEKAQRYVARIVAHGGIPRYCVADLFSLVFRDLPHSANARDMLARWRSRLSTFAGIDRPVERFFRYGGPIAVDFLDRCIDLVRHEVITGELPAPDEIGLPPHILTAYREIDQRRTRATVSTRNIARAFSPPLMTLDPWAATGPVITLPPLGEMEPGRWELHGEGLQRFETSRFDAREVPLTPATRWSVVLSSADEHRDWTFDASEFGPFLMFDPLSGRRLDPAAGLRLDDVWLFAFRDVRVTVVRTNGDPDDLHDIEELPLPIGTWDGWKVRHVDLHDVATLVVIHGEGERRITVRSASARPTLIPEPLEGITADDGVAVYGEIPHIQLPGATDPSLWSVRIVADNTAPITQAASELTDAHGRVALTQLVHPDASRIRIVVRGPLGDTLRRDVVVVPGLHVDRPQKLILPDVESAVTWSAASGSFGNAPSAESASTPVGADRDSVQIDWHGPNGRIGLVARVPKLLWGSVTVEGTVLGATSVRLISDDLGSEVVGLAVSTGMAMTCISLDLCAGTDVLHTTEERDINATGRWVFGLGEFVDTLRASSETSFDLVLRVLGHRIRVASLRATLDVQSLVAHSRVAGDVTTIHLEFDQRRALKHRVVRLWPMTRPWQKPVSQPLDDDVMGQATITRYDNELAPGRYLVELTIDDGWGPPPVRPTLGPATAMITIGTNQDLHDHVDRLPLADPHSVLEIAAITGTIARRLEPEELAAIAPGALVALRDLLHGRYAHVRQRNSIVSLLLADQAAMVGALIDVAASTEWSAAELLEVQIQLINRLDSNKCVGNIADHTSRSLWAAAPVIAGALDIQPDASDVVCDRIEGACAWNPQLPATTIEPGEPVDQRFAGMPLDQLDQIIIAMELPVDVPSPWLHIDAFVRAQFQWLRAHKLGELDAERWWREAEAITAAPLPGVQAAETHLTARYAQKGTFPWAALPAATFAAACHIIADSNLQPNAAQLLTDLASQAPLMVTRDLLLALVLDRCAAETHLERTIDEHP